MKEAGYEWDAEKKELTKVEPKFKIELFMKDLTGQRKHEIQHY